ncbi:MAG: SseB family protein [Chloroflexota bacterium]|nr:SseB family protein [Chloroflexota bacterium]
MTEPRLADLMERDLIVPVRSSSGERPDPSSVALDRIRHGTDRDGRRFLAAFATPQSFAEFGPAGSDYVTLPARLLFARADEAGERVVVDPGAPSQVAVAVGVLPYLAAGIDPNRPDAQRARRPLGEPPPLEAPGEIPEPFGSALHRALEELPQVERAWLLRVAEKWVAGIQLVPDAELVDFDAVRNYLHALATEHLGSRTLLTVTDLRSPALRDEFDAFAAPFYVANRPAKGFLSRLLGA